MRLNLLGHGENDLFLFILSMVLPYLLSTYSLSYMQAGGILNASGFAGSLGLFLLLVSITAVGVSTIHPVRYFGFEESTAAFGSAFFFAGGIAGSCLVFRLPIADSTGLLFLLRRASGEPGRGLRLSSVGTGA